jgi:hypothetical protein
VCNGITLQKDGVVLPTVVLESVSVFVTSAIEAHEKREVVMIDIPGVFYRLKMKITSS